MRARAVGGLVRWGYICRGFRIITKKETPFAKFSKWRLFFSDNSLRFGLIYMNITNTVMSAKHCPSLIASFYLSF